MKSLNSLNKNSIMMSIRPEWVAKILNGEKTVDVRKTQPKLTTPFLCYIYCTQGKELWGDGIGETWWGVDPNEDIEDVFKLNPTLTQLNGKVIGEFVCNYIAHSNEHLFDENKTTMQKLMKSSCLSFEEINNYRGDKNIFAWHISDLKIYDKPKELDKFRQICKLFNNRICGLRTMCGEQKGICDGHKKLTRPPQSWCYVKQLGDYDNE